MSCKVSTTVNFVMASEWYLKVLTLLSHAVLTYPCSNTAAAMQTLALWACWMSYELEAGLSAMSPVQHD